MTFRVTKDDILYLLSLFIVALVVWSLAIVPSHLAEINNTLDQIIIKVPVPMERAIPHEFLHPQEMNFIPRCGNGESYTFDGSKWICTHISELEL